MKYEFIKNSSMLLTAEKDEDILFILADNWDDNQVKASFDMYYNEQKIGIIKIFKKGYRETIDAIIKDDLLDMAKDVNYGLPGYYSLATNEKVYDNLYQIMGRPDAEQFLKSIHDIAFNNEYIKDIQDEYQYKYSFLRGIDENYIYSLNRYARHYSDNEFKLSVNYSKSDEYLRSTYTFDFNPQTEISSNLHAVIGNNGVGKTRLLRDIAQSVSQRKNIKDIPSEFLTGYSLPELSINFAENDNKNFGINSAVYISLSPFDKPSKSFILNSKINSEFDKDNSKSKAEPKYYSNYFLTLENMFNNLDGEIVKQLSKIKINDVASNNRRKIIQNFVWDSMLVDFWSKDMDTFFELIDKDDNAELQKQFMQKFDGMSSGQKNIIIILILVLANIRVNSLLIIDEPENYLHPPYISTFIKCLSEILKNLNSGGIISTHSDVVIQGLPTQCVHILRIDKEMYTLQDFNTYGESLDLINENIFGLDMERTGFYAKLRELVSSSKVDLASSNLKETLGTNLGSQAQIYLSLLEENKNNVR